MQRYVSKDVENIDLFNESITNIRHDLVESKKIE